VRVAAAFLSLFVALGEAFAQNVTIKGRVVELAGRAPNDVTVSAVEITSAATTRVKLQSDASFELSVPPAIYVLMTEVPAEAGDRLLHEVVVAARVDARTSVSGLQLRLGERIPLLPDAPPRASLIHVSVPDAAGDVTVTGGPGCVAPNSSLALVTLDTGHAVATQARDDGSFEASLFAPFGTSIMIKVDALGLEFSNLRNTLQVGEGTSRFAEVPGTIVNVVEPPSTGNGVPFGRAGLVPRTIASLPAWTFQGTINSQTLAPGGALTVDATLRVVSPALVNAAPVRFQFEMNLERAESGAGAQLYASTVLTPTGLPIERQRTPGGALRVSRELELQKVAPDRGEVRIQATMTLPQDIPAGYYIPEVSFSFFNAPVESPPTRMVMGIDGLPRRDQLLSYLPVVKVGSPPPPRLHAMLLLDRLSNGVRGTHAIEDRGRFALSSRIRVAGDTLVVPRVDAGGKPVTYSLEPFAPAAGGVGISIRFPVPVIPFRFPSGQLSVRIRKPDGTATVIGPVPLVQNRLRSDGLRGTTIDDPNMIFTSAGGNVIRQAYQLTSLDPRFDVQFDQDGLHIVTVEGFVEDVWGNRWSMDGTHEIHVGRHLSLETAVVAGTPFEVGDVVSPAVTLTPPVPANIEVRVRLLPDSDPARMIERTVGGRANRFGVFAPVDGIRLEQQGEYRFDVTATYADAAGNVWTGARTWGNVVAPRDSPILAHGRRGMINTDILGSPWYFRSHTARPVLPDDSHPMPPFHSGDVFWAQKSDTEFVQFTFQDDLSGALTSLLRQRHIDIRVFGPGTFDERVTLGELPLVSSRADGIDPHINPEAVDLWAYSYRFVERPLIAVREGIAEEQVQLMYWGFTDPYAGQIGMGPDGDLPNDFKFHFGGVVLRGSALSRPVYAAYGSLFVLIPDNDARGGSRIFPPFQGNGAGPSGGPLFTLKGKDVDIFFYLTSIKPGAIVETGKAISFAGQVAPTLPAKVEITVISPSGVQSVVGGIANRVGYFFDDRSRVIANEPGVWRARVKTWFDGILPSTNGRVEPPYPSGDVLGSRQGEFFFYVVDRESEPLNLQASGKTFTITAPAGLNETQLSYTTTMPGFILEEGTSNTLQYVYDPVRLRAQFPNLDADVVTISFLLAGVDASGDRKYFARQVALRGEELHMPAQEPVTPRRRSARH